MRYHEMRGIIKRLDAACGGHWFMRGAQEPETEFDSRKSTQFADPVFPRNDGSITPRKIWIGTTENTEPIAYLSDYLMPAAANAAFIAHARDDMLLLIKEITALNAELMHYRRAEVGGPRLTDAEALDGARRMISFDDEASAAQQGKEPGT